MKRVILKKKPMVPVAKAPKVEVHLIPAIEMEPGVEYASTSCGCVLTLNKIIPYEGPETGLRALRSTAVECTSLNDLGGKNIANLWGTSGVLADCPELVARIKKEHEGMAKHWPPYGEKAKPKRLGTDGKELPPKERKPRGSADSRTGCSAGSQGHVLGTIMLDNKCSPANRAKIMPLMQQVLMKDYGFDEKKAKGLASSWYSTLWTRKPEIYQKGK